MTNSIIKKWLILLICPIFMLGAWGCQPQKGAVSEPVKKTQFLLGTICDITIYDKVDEIVFDEAFSRISEIEKKMTINNAETSEIIKLNEASGKTAVKVSPDTFFVLEKGLYYSALTKGSFDITIGPVVKQWNIGTDYAAVPQKDKLAEAIRLVDYTKLHLDKDALTAKLDIAGAKVDLGAIAKGYAADEAAAVLIKNGVKHAIVNLGGNILTIGQNPNGNPWKIGVQDPFNPRGEYVGIMQIKDASIVSSGTYERFFEQDGKIYHHILDPKTGYPAENNLSSVSIVTSKSIDGDGLSTSTFLLGLEEGMKLVEKLEGVEAVFITKDKKVYVSSGLKDKFALTNNEFTIVNQ